MRVVVRTVAATGHLPPPGADEVHVWQFRLDPPVDGAEQVLSAAERGRADRYRVPRARRQFVAARGMLRVLLGRYIGCPPGAVPLAAEPGGKPTLGPGAGPHFNLSHSAGVGLVAVAGRPVGVDVEEVRDLPNAEGLVERFYAAEERAAFARLPAGVREDGFFRAWTCKEALLKAVGRGLQDLEGCVVELDPRRAPRVVRFDPGPWQLAVWEPWPGYAAAVAVESPEPLRLEPEGDGRKRE